MAALGHKYYNRPKLYALAQRSDVEIENCDILAIDDSISVGRFCAFRDQGSGTVPRSIALGRDCWIAPAVEFVVGDNQQIRLKGDTSVNEGTKIYGSVTIEKYCLLAPRVYISSGNHQTDYIPSFLIKDQDRLCIDSGVDRKLDQPVHVEEDCWIGMGALLRQGVYIGRGAVIGSYSVVTKDVSPYSIHVGAPNREVKTRLNFCPPDELRADEQELLPYFYRGFRHRLEERSESLKRGIILADNHAAVILSKKECFRLKIKGQLNPGTTSIQLRIQLNGQAIGAISIDKRIFDCEVEMRCDDDRSRTPHTSVPSVLQSFNFYTFDIADGFVEDPTPNGCVSHYGLSMIQQVP